MKRAILHSKHQSGQAILLIAMVMVALIASLGLAIDGGGMFLMYRDVQNATDAAALSAAFALCTGENPVPAGEASAELNGFINSVDGAIVLIENPPTTGNPDYIGDVNYVSIKIEQEKPSYFIQIVYPGPLTVNAQTISQCSGGNDFGIPDGAALVSFSPGCAASSGGANNAPVRTTGGSDLSIKDGGIFLNTTSCAAGSVDTNGSGSNIDVEGDICADVAVDGASNITASSETTPCPADTITWDIDPFVDAGLEPPTCTGATGLSLVNGNNSPGTYTSFDIGNGWTNVFLESGIYCITDQAVQWNDGIVSSTDGVFLYFDGTSGTNGISGNGGVETKLYGLDDSSSDYNNLLIWFDDRNSTISNSNSIEFQASSTTTLTGTIYAPRKHCNIQGSATVTITGQLLCYSFDNNGNGPACIIYKEALSFQIPETFGITE